MAKQANRNNDVAFECQTLLRFQEFILEASATTQGYHFKSIYHLSILLKLFIKKQEGTKPLFYPIFPVRLW
jgi:hypothetical protein